MFDFDRKRRPSEDDHRMLFRLFSQLLRETYKLPLPLDVAHNVAWLQMQIEEFLSKMEPPEREFNLERFRALLDPKNPEEVV